MNRLDIGIALGEGEATALTRAAGATSRVTVPVEFGNGTPLAGALAAAFARIARGFAEQLGGEVEEARVSVALLPPLADARLIRLPPLKRAEAESVIRRDAARHFVGGSGTRVVAVLPAASDEPDQPGVVFLAAAAPATLVEALHAAARTVGWSVRSVVAAHGAWLDAARGTRGAGTVLAADGETVHVLRLAGGRCVSLRRAPAALPEAVLEAIGPEPGAAVLFAGPAVRDTIKANLAGAGWRVDDGRLATATEAAAARAHASRLEFVSPSAAAERRERGRRNIVRAVGAAVLLVAAAGAVELWGLHRELDSVVAERVAIRDQVAPLLAMRDSIDRVDAEAGAVQRLATRSPRWTRALFDLALLLPPDTHITSMHTTGDTLVVEATAARAGNALQALRKAGSLTDVRLVGTVERDLEGGTTTSERFRFRARLKPPVEVPAVRAAPAPTTPGTATGDAGARP
jgi:Tfp pilus assembly protein PilN